MVLPSAPIGLLSLCGSQSGEKHTQSKWTGQPLAVCCTGLVVSSTLKDGWRLCRAGGRRKCLAHIGSSPKLQVRAAGRGEVGRVLTALGAWADTQQTSSRRCCEAGKHCIPKTKAVTLDILSCLGDHTTLSSQIKVMIIYVSSI